jgi:hypothetical protein
MAGHDATGDLHPEGVPGGYRELDVPGHQRQMRRRDGAGIFPAPSELFSCSVMNSDAEAGIGVFRLAHS